MPATSNVAIGTYCKMSATINKCQVLSIEMLGTHPIAGIHETVRY